MSSTLLDKPLPSSQHDAQAGQWNLLKPYAREMRHEATPAEKRLWQMVRDRRLGGLKFRRQYVIDRFVADFACLEKRLVIEVDGSIHNARTAEDAFRQAEIEAQGFRVLRFTNEEVMQGPETVRATVLEVAQSTRAANPLHDNAADDSPSPYGQGGRG